MFISVNLGKNPHGVWGNTQPPIFFHIVENSEHSTFTENVKQFKKKKSIEKKNATACLCFNLTFCHAWKKKWGPTKSISTGNQDLEKLTVLNTSPFRGFSFPQGHLWSDYTEAKYRKERKRYKKNWNLVIYTNIYLA